LSKDNEDEKYVLPQLYPLSRDIAGCGINCDSWFYKLTTQYDNIVLSKFRQVENQR